jgi:uncharacterized protein (TIGR02265 family)
MSETFESPAWDAPLDADWHLRAIPPAATLKGMFTAPILVEARRRGIVFPNARERYLPFVDYPLAEHARLLVDAAHAFFPNESLRRGLRRLGHQAVDAFQHSTVGRVMWSGATDPAAALEVMVKGYGLVSPLTSLELVERGPGRTRLRAAHVHWFLDSHHVGVFEGILRACGAAGRVTVRLDSPSDGELLCTWG